ncbi:MAG: hypothetical protein IJ714_07300, partial [Bacteroidales bacterium]|nr:hypothetical protein [Bacteroidales bacterium]
AVNRASRVEAHVESPEGIFVLHPTAWTLAQARFRPSMRLIVLQELKHTLNHQKAFSYFTPLPGPWLKHIFGLPCG